MRRTPILTTSLLGCAALLACIGPAGAQAYRMPEYRPAASVFPPNRMPGWDWWRTYPWSPYNYGRNPYNPAWVPYYPYPYPYPMVYSSGYAGLPNTTMVPNQYFGPVLTPHPSGGYNIPPADAAQIVVRLPDPWAKVYFDDQQTYTQGTSTRYFVTPSLPGDKPYGYTVKATWTREGQPVTEERQIQVSPGHTTMVDFTQPEGQDRQYPVG